ncbi:MAG: hypothetical protein WDA18_09630 [Candidatus Ratteibacteria bacterium]
MLRLRRGLRPLPHLNTGVAFGLFALPKERRGLRPTKSPANRSSLLLPQMRKHGGEDQTFLLIFPFFCGGKNNYKEEGSEMIVVYKYETCPYRVGDFCSYEAMTNNEMVICPEGQICEIEVKKYDILYHS